MLSGKGFGRVWPRCLSQCCKELEELLPPPNVERFLQLVLVMQVWEKSAIFFRNGPRADVGRGLQENARVGSLCCETDQRLYDMDLEYDVDELQVTAGLRMGS